MKWSFSLFKQKKSSEIDRFIASRNQRFSLPPMMVVADVRKNNLYIPEPGQYLVPPKSNC